MFRCSAIRTATANHQIARAVRMAEQRDIQLFGGLIVRIVGRIIEIARAAIRNEMARPETQLLDAMPELVRHRLRTASRGHGYGPEEILVAFDQLGYPVVVAPRQGCA